MLHLRLRIMKHFIVNGENLQRVNVCPGLRGLPQVEADSEKGHQFRVYSEKQ